MSDAVSCVSIDGRLVPADAPVIRADDRGFVHGDGAFETVALLDGVPQGWAWHLERLRAGLQVLGIDAPIGGLRGALDALVRANGCGVGRATARISVSRGWGEPPCPTVLLTTRPAPSPRDSVDLVCVPATRTVASVKALSYLPAVLARRAHPGAEPLFVEGDEVLEGATTNLFACDGSTLVTPAADGRILPGVMRRAVGEVCGDAGLRLERRRLTCTEVLTSECFVTNALVGLVPVARLDGVALRAPGPWLDALREGAFARLAVDSGGVGGAGRM